MMAVPRGGHLRAAHESVNLVSRDPRPPLRRDEHRWKRGLAGAGVEEHVQIVALAAVEKDGFPRGMTLLESCNHGIQHLRRWTLHVDILSLQASLVYRHRICPFLLAARMTLYQLVEKKARLPILLVLVHHAHVLALFAHRT